MGCFSVVRDMVNWFRHSKDAKEFSTYIVFVVIFSISASPLPLLPPRPSPSAHTKRITFALHQVWVIFVSPHHCVLTNSAPLFSPPTSSHLPLSLSLPPSLPLSLSRSLPLVLAPRLAVAFAGTPGDIQYHLNGYARSA